MARITILFWCLFSIGFVFELWAQPRVVTAMVHSDETYVVGKSKKDVRQYGTGDTIYLVLDTPSTKKCKGKYRVTFDPTNLKGDGCIDKTSVRIVSNYYSSDGKLPKEYDKKYVEQTSQVASIEGGGDDLLSLETSFIGGLVEQEQSSLDQAFGGGSDVSGQAAIVPLEEVTEGDNPFEEDLAFLFNDADPTFSDALTSTKNEIAGKGPKNIGISSFSSGSDKKDEKFANELRSKFEAALLKYASNVSRVDAVSYVQQIDTPAGASNVNIKPDVHGVFFGVLGKKMGKSRLFKIKYFDPSIKSFESFEKTVNLPLKNYDSILEGAAQEAAQYLK